MITADQQSGSRGDAHLSALVVESNKLVAETIVDALSDIGYEPVETASSIQAALDIVDEENIDLAILETDVRGHSTEPVLIALDAKDIAHVVASSEGCVQLPWRAPYLQKPFGLSELKAAVSHAHALASVRSWNRLH